jgi:hypothetical protein
MPRRVFPALSVLLAAVAGGALLAPPAVRAEPICVMIMPDVGGAALFNRCNSCREVTLERVRAGESIPNVRTMILPAESATPEPFRGPGRTRILGERSCPPPPGRGLAQPTLRR